MSAVPVSVPLTRSKPAALVRALRPQQWVKNLLLFVPVVLDHRLFDPAAISWAAAAFATFCLAASGAYVLNDILDVEADRRHPTKRHRPFASGVLSPALGLALVPLLFLAALGVGLLIPTRHFLSLVVLYVLATTTYSAYFKQIAVLDVLLLAGLYTLRVLAGVAATGVRFSAWLLAFSMFLFLSLAFLKRYAELTGMSDDVDETARRRGYLRMDREWLGSMGGASGYLSVLVLALYINSDQVIQLYRRPLALWLVCPLLLFWIGRMWLMAYRGQIHEDPIVATVRDPMSYLVGMLVGAIVIAATL
jgi:4-hydroxybenzoate polyprenyltransferase